MNSYMTSVGGNLSDQEIDEVRRWFSRKHPEFGCWTCLRSMVVSGWWDGDGCSFEDEVHECYEDWKRSKERKIRTGDV